MDIPMLRKHLAVALAGAVVLAGCSSSPPAARPSVTFGSGAGASPSGSPAAVAGDQVSIDNFAFAPATLTVTVGSTVTWTNHDEEPHTVAASDGSFHSP